MPPRDVAWIYELLHRYGSIDYARRAARELVRASLNELEVAFAGANDGPDKAFVRALVEYMIERQV